MQRGVSFPAPLAAVAPADVELARTLPFDDGERALLVLRALELDAEEKSVARPLRPGVGFPLEMLRRFRRHRADCAARRGNERKMARVPRHEQRRERAGGEIQYMDSRLTLRTEAIGARDGNLRRFGWYGLSAVRPTPHLQLVGRFDSWDRDLSQELTLLDATERQMTVGVSYLLDPSTKLAFNVIRQTFPNVATPRSGTILMAAFQAVW